MKISGNDIDYRRLTTPRAASIAGILFGVLFTACLILFRTAIPADPSAGVEWLEAGERRIVLALELVPFAGIAFLWFIGVVRDRLGRYEDQFFSTVFLGSGLLFLAMVFISSAIAGSLIAYHRAAADVALEYEIIHFGRVMMIYFSNIFALRMAGVFMLSLGTIWLRTGLMPRWLVILTYLLAVTLLIIINLSLWVTLIFPGWVMIISVKTLLTNSSRLT
jgi:hypothetical protein